MSLLYPLYSLHAYRGLTKNRGLSKIILDNENDIKKIKTGDMILTETKGAPRFKR